MSDEIYYDDEESIALAEALQKKAEQEAMRLGKNQDEIKQAGIKKFNEVRRKHAIDFLKTIDKKLDSLSNQTVANLLRALIAAGLDIEDEEELEYWINLLTRESFHRMDMYFSQRSQETLWNQLNKKVKVDLSYCSIEDISGLLNIVKQLNRVNKYRKIDGAVKKRADEILKKIQNLLQNDVTTKKKELNNKRTSSRNSKRDENTDDIARTMLQNKLTAADVEKGGKYWELVMDEFNLSTEKMDYAVRWSVNENLREQFVVQKINELRGVDDQKERGNREEQERIQQERLIKEQEEAREQEKSQKEIEERNKKEREEKENKEKEEQKNKENAKEQLSQNKEANKAATANKSSANNVANMAKSMGGR